MSKFVTAPGKGTAVAAPAAPVDGGNAVATVEQSAGAVTQDARKKRGKAANFVGLGIKYESLDKAKENVPQFAEGFEGDEQKARDSIRILEVTGPNGETFFTWANNSSQVLANVAKELGWDASLAERSDKGRNRIPSEDKALTILWKSLIKAGKTEKARSIMQRDYPEQQANFDKLVAEMATAA